MKQNVIFFQTFAETSNKGDCFHLSAKPLQICKDKGWKGEIVHRANENVKEKGFFHCIWTEKNKTSTTMGVTDNKMKEKIVTLPLMSNPFTCCTLYKKSFI